MRESAWQWHTLPASALREDAVLRVQWDSLNDAHLALPFLSADVALAAIDAFGDGGERVVVARRGGAVEAMALMVRDGRIGWRTFQPSQLPLGAWVGARGLDLAALGESLARSGLLPRAWIVSWTQVDPRHTPRGLDSPTQRYDDYIDTSWIDVQGSFDDYWSQRGKNLRQNLRKQRNRLTTDGTVTEMRVTREASAMAGVVERYGALESGGWKAGQGTAIHPDNAQGRFYRSVLEQAAQRGQAFVTECLFDDKTVAMNLGVMRGDTLVVLKTTYDETVPKALSPASLLREDEMRLVFEEARVARIEFYGRTMEWHTKLTDQKRTLYHLTIYRWAWLARLARWRRERAAVAMPAEAATTSTPT
jgi:hypothetical protein